MSKVSKIGEEHYNNKGCSMRIVEDNNYEEYAKDNITKQCYEAMMNYEVEITD